MMEQCKEKLSIAMFGQKRIPSREGGVEIVVEELCTRMVAKSTIRSVKNPLVDITIRSLFLYNSLTISFKSVLMKGSPPVMFVKYILGSFFIVSMLISSSGFEGALYLLHMLQRALHL